MLSGLATAYFLPGPGLAYLIVLLAFALLLLRRFDAWLVVLPAIIPTIDLGLWSGRLFFNEMDALVLVVCGCFLLTRGGGALPSLGRPPMTYVLFVAVAVIGGAIALIPLPDFTGHTPFDYLSPYNAIRVVRPMLWALLLWWPFIYLWRRDERLSAEQVLAGVAIGLVGFGMIVLWERGVLLAVFATFNPYAILGTLLDTTTTYRVTGLFAEMHTGGTAVDAYLSIAVPLACAGTIVPRNWPLRLLCFAALLLGLYAAMATFSRGLYLAVGLSLAYYLFIFVGKIQEQIGLKNRTKVIIILSMVAFVIVAYASFVRAGYVALSYALIYFFAIAILRYALSGRWGKLFLPAVVALGLLVFLQLQGAFVESRYNPLSSGDAGLAAGAITLLIMATAVPLALSLRPILPAVYVLPVMALFAVICVVSIPSLTGYRMGERFATAQQDLTGRFDHWGTTYSFLGESPLSYLVGIGPGAFPRHYFWSDRRREERISYVFTSEQGTSFLRISGGDFNITQKVSVRPNSVYRIDLQARAPSDNTQIVVSLCPKLVLFFDRYQSRCVRASERLQEVGVWRTLSFEVNSGELGSNWPLRMPPTLMLSSGGVVDITDLRLSNDWDNLVENGDFSSAGDHWIMVSDFNHLSWHAKNFPLHVLVEHGVLGLIAMGAAMVLAIARLKRAKASQSLLAHGLIAALISFFLVGLFGTLIDNTRPALLFYLVLLWALSFPQAGSRADSRGTVNGRGEVARAQTL